MEKEIWKSVPTFIGYEVSNLGRVRSIDREVVDTIGRVQRKVGTILKPLNSTIYHAVTLVNSSGGRSQVKIHKCVALAFLDNDYKSKGLVVDHIDNNPLNNNLNNLQIITIRENSSKDRKGYSSKYVGVSWMKKNKKWTAQIVVGGRLSINCP